MSAADWLYVDTAPELEALAARLQGSPWLALDTEFIRERTYFPQLCLMQVATSHEAVAIDRNKRHGVGGKTSAVKHRLVLNRRNIKPAYGKRSSSHAEVRRQDEIGGFGRACRERHMRGFRSHQRCHRAACPLNNSSCSTAFGMHRRGIARHGERLEHGIARRVHQGRGGVPVEIDALNSHPQFGLPCIRRCIFLEISAGLAL